MTALRVLVVEDDAMIGLLLTEMLKDMGYDVCAVAATEEDAVSNAVLFKPGLMIVDEHLREGGGRSAVDRILRDGPVPCVFIGGGPTHPNPANGHTLRKPFQEADLARAIQRVIDGAAAPATHSAAPPH